MSSMNGAEAEKSPATHKSRNHSTDTHRTRRSNRSISRDRDRRERHRHERRRSRSRDRYHDRDRTPDRYRDRDRRRDRDSDRHRERRRDRADSRHSHRDYDNPRDREERDRDRDRDRRRKRADDVDGPEEERVKRKKVEGSEAQDGDVTMSPPQTSTASPKSRRSDSRRRSRPPRDSRDEEGLRYRDRDHRDDRRRRRDSPSPPPKKRHTPNYEPPAEEPYNPDEPKEDDSEARSVFVTQLAARMTARDLGYFFEDKLGEGTVTDSRIVTDRISRRSKGIGYVEFRTIELVEKAIALTGTVVMGLPIMVQLTEAERNRLHAGDGNLNLPPGVSAPHGAILYVGSLHFNLSESDIKQVFEPFGPLEFVDLHRDPVTGRSKGYAFVQYKRAEHAKMALEQMEGFELAGRTLRVNTVHEKGTTRYTQQDSLDDSGGGNLNAASRQALMQKLARIESTPSLPDPVRPNIPTQAMQSRSVLLKNMFDPEEESERDWDKDLAEDVKGECEEKYGKVDAIKVEKETQGEIYVKFDSVDTAKAAVQGLNGRWFGGKQVTATFISDAIMQAHQ